MKTPTLKTAIIAISLAATGAFGAERGLPFEITQFDRGLSNAPQRTDSAPASAGASVAARGAGLASGAWAKDHNFTAPPR